MTKLMDGGGNEWARLWLEQGGLGRSAHAVGASLLYFPYAAAPISSPVPVIAWLGCGGGRPRGRGPIARLRATLGAAGLTGAAGLIPLEEESQGTSGERRFHVPPMVPPAFGAETPRQVLAAAAPYDLPPAYVLSACGSPEDAGLLLAAWTWVASAMGDSLALAVMAGAQVAREIRSRMGPMSLRGSVRILDAVRGEDLPAVYGAADTFLFAGWGHSGEAVRRALAAGLPIVGSQTPESARVVGDAGYLVPGRDARLLGAACLTVLVEPEVAARLQGKAKARGAALMGEAPLRILLTHLERVAARN